MHGGVTTRAEMNAICDLNAKSDESNGDKSKTVDIMARVKRQNPLGIPLQVLAAAIAHAGHESGEKIAHWIPHKCKEMPGSVMV